MKQITLVKLELVNYRNIPYQVLNFNGNSKIVGDNRVGKTNTLEAIYWLLTDKLLNGSSEIDQIKPLSNTKEKVTVSATFSVEGRDIELKKEYQEEWVKTRGTFDLVFKGHSTTYYYNGVKQGTKKQYDSLFLYDFGIDCKDYQGIDIVQLLINPLYLGKMGDTLEWKNLRGLIIDIVGDVKDEDVFAANPSLSIIKSDLEINMGRTDQVVKKYNDEIKGVKEDIIRCEGVIDNLQKTECPPEEVVATARQGIIDCDAKIHSLTSSMGNDAAINAIDSEINGLRYQIIELKRKDLEKKNSNPNEQKKNELLNKREEIANDIKKLSSDRAMYLELVSSCDHEISHNEKMIDECKTNRLNLIDELEDIDKMIENPPVEGVCPHCHRPYDAAMINELIALDVEKLNAKKNTLILKGKDNNVKMNEYQDAINGLNEKKEDYNKEIARIESSAKASMEQVKEIDKEIEHLNNVTVVDNKPNPAIEDLEGQIRAKELEKSEIRNSINSSNESIRSLVASEQQKKESFQKVIDDYNFAQRIGEKIGSTEADMEALRKRLASLEQKIELAKSFVKAKLEMLDSNIAKVFGDISFMLIEPQINGGYNTVCKPYIKGTKTLWKSGSKSEQVTTGVAICEKIKVALNLPDLPFLFDEGGEISSDTFANRFETNTQLICVQVKDGISTPTVMSI